MTRLPPEMFNHGNIYSELHEQNTLHTLLSKLCTFVSNQCQISVDFIILSTLFILLVRGIQNAKIYLEGVYVLINLNCSYKNDNVYIFK